MRAGWTLLKLTRRRSGHKLSHLSSTRLTMSAPLVLAFTVIKDYCNIVDSTTGVFIVTKTRNVMIDNNSDFCLRQLTSLQFRAHLTTQTTPRNPANDLITTNITLNIPMRAKRGPSAT